MKSTIARTAFAVVFAVSLMLSMAASAQAWDHPCSTASAAGKWSITDQGTVVDIGPRTAVGVFTLDGNGNLTNGVATSSLNGSIASETLSGTYTVNPDCTGSVSVKIYSGSTELFALTGFLAFDSDMRHMRGIFTSVVTPDGTTLATVVNLDGKKQ